MGGAESAGAASADVLQEHKPWNHDSITPEKKGLVVTEILFEESLDQPVRLILLKNVVNVCQSPLM